MVSSVINGDYKGYGIKATISGKLVAQKWSDKVFFDSSTIKSYEVLSKDEGKSSLGKTVGLGMLFGTAGALAGANSKKGGKTTIKVEWQDGGKSIIELDKPLLDIFYRNCPL